MNSKTAPVPPGWSDWHVSNNSGYAEYNYYLNDNGTVHYYSGPGKFGVDVLNGDTYSFIKHSDGKPFAIEVSTFAPHDPYTPAPRNAKDFPGLKAPREPSFNTNNVNPPAWLGSRPPIDRGPNRRAGQGFPTARAGGRVRGQARCRHRGDAGCGTSVR